MKNKIVVSTVLTCLIGVQVWFLYVTFHYAYYGVILQKNAQDHWVIAGFESDSIRLRSGLQVGDMISKVDGKEPKEHMTINKWGALEQSNVVVISRNGFEFEIVMKDKIQPNLDYISLFNEIFSLCVSFLIYLKIPNSKSARFLSLVFLISGLVFMSISSSFRGDSLAKYLISSLVMGYPLVFLHFLILFFREKGHIQLPIKFVYGLYVMIGIFSIVKLSYLTPLMTYDLYRIDYFSVLAFFLLGLLLNLTMFLYIHFKYRRTDSSIRAIIRLIWFAFFVSCAPLAFLSFIPILIFQQPIVEPMYTGLFIMFFPLSFCYLIVTKQLYDISLILRRIFYTTFVAIIPSGIIVGLNAFIFNRDASLHNLLYSFLFIVTIVSFLLYFLEYFAIRLDAVMFPRKHHLQAALKKISQNLRTITTFREFKDMVLVDMVNTLQVHGAAIVFHYQDAMETIGEGELNLAEIEKSLASRTMDENKYAVFEINRHEEYASYLVTTRKKNRTVLGKEERQWLNLIISYLAVSLENVYLIRKLTLRLHELASQIPNGQAGPELVWLRKSLFELQERERFRIATDLHDTTMQDILLIRRRLLAYLERPTDPQQLVSAVKHLELINENLRQSCFELNPYLLQRIGLIRTIEMAIELNVAVYEFETHFHVEGEEAVEALDLEIKKHLFRIVQELLHNANKHSKASQVSIKLGQMERYLCLFYQDNGVGMDIGAWEEDERLETVSNSGWGLQQMRSRIVHLSGHMELESRKGNGLQITFRIPMEERMVV